MIRQMKTCASKLVSQSDTKGTNNFSTSPKLVPLDMQMMKYQTFKKQKMEPIQHQQRESIRQI